MMAPRGTREKLVSRGGRICSSRVHTCNYRKELHTRHVGMNDTTDWREEWFCSAAKSCNGDGDGNGLILSMGFRGSLTCEFFRIMFTEVQMLAIGILRFIVYCC